MSQSSFPFSPSFHIRTFRLMKLIKSTKPTMAPQVLSLFFIFGCLLLGNGAAGRALDSGRPEFLDLCVLPLGDSLTQGVGSHGSYRQPLHDMMTEYLSNFTDGHGRRYFFSYTGSNERTCTPKKPNEQFPDDVFTEKHEGHCGFNARSLNIALRSAISEYPCLPHVTTLMVGHNDAFQTARTCKLKELDASPSSRDVNCAANMMREVLREEITSMVDLLLRLRRTSHVLIGINPTTRFPVLDTIIRKALEHVVAVFRPKSDGSKPGPTPSLRVHLVNFTGWSSADTFDSTHPNKAGSHRLAAAWFEAIKKIVSATSPPPPSDQPDTEIFQDEVPQAKLKLIRRYQQPASLEDSRAHEPQTVSNSLAVDSSSRFHIIFGVVAVAAFVAWLRNRRGVAYRRIPFATV